MQTVGEPLIVTDTGSRIVYATQPCNSALAGKLWAMPKGGGAAYAVANHEHKQLFTVGGDYVYFARFSPLGIYRVAY